MNASIRMVRDESVSLTTNPTASPYSKVRQTLITTPSDSDFTLKRSRSRSWMLKERYEEGTLALEKTRPAAVTGSAITIADCTTAPVFP